jgi:enolase
MGYRATKVVSVISGDSLKDVYKSFVSEYPILSIEDPFDQDDWATYAKLTEEIGQPCKHYSSRFLFKKEGTFRPLH